MSALLADIDATCASLGYFDGVNYHPEDHCLQSLKHLIWILRRDNEIHEYRRYLGRGKVLQTDLLPMIMQHTNEDELSDVLLRLLLNLTNPALLLYREELPKDGPGRRNFMELIEILQNYKEAFSLQPVWASFGTRLQKVLEIDWAVRSEEQGLLIERILVLIRNVLAVPASPDTERRADNDASLHDQVLWSLHQAGVLDIVLYVIASEFENQYHLHALEILSLVYREQTAESLADASLQRSAAEKQRDEQELISVRRREKARFTMRPPPGRHSRFGGTYVLANTKSISDNDIICHQSLSRAVAMDFDREKETKKRSHRVVKEEQIGNRRSAFSVRLFLREFCIEILESAFNNLIRHVRRVLERSTTGHDDSYLLWALKFFMEFNRTSGFKLQLVSESLSTQCFHWVLSRVQHHMDMIGSDKKNGRQWGKRLHLATLAYKELLLSLIALQKVNDEDAKSLYKMLQNNVCYVMEFRETALQTLMNYSEMFSTKAYLRDVIEMCHIFCKIMENFCKGGVLVQTKQKRQRNHKNKNKKSSKKSLNDNQNDVEENLENIWPNIASQISVVLSSDISLPEHEHPLPYDGASDETMDNQKDGCMIKIHKLLRQEKFEHAIILLRSAREIWSEEDCFGSLTAAPEDELMLLRDIFLTDLGPVEKTDDVNNSDDDRQDSEDDDDDEEDDEEGGGKHMAESDFRFEDFEKRLVNPRVVRACTIVLTDWNKITARALKSAVTILHRIAFSCKIPAMLYQASLFRIFQHVFHSPYDQNREELRKLAVYIMRQFIQHAQPNPKIYAELLFYKNLRECNDLDMGYDAPDRDVKRGWTDEQEAELQQLYMENQNNPSTDQDVIDWIQENLIDSSRTRRAIIIKLKDMGLIFKAPTKKKNALPKNYWGHADDQRLRDLYDTNRLESDCLARIIQSITPKRTKKFIIDKMIEIGLIADSSEILPKRKTKKSSKKSNQPEENDNNDTDSTDNDDNDNDSDNNSPAPQKNHNPQKLTKNKKPPPKRKIPKPKIQINLNKCRDLITNLNEEIKTAIDWIEESLNDAAQDMEAISSSDDPDDCIPLVPWAADQRTALGNADFKDLLRELGMLEPIVGQEIYWRIPNNLSSMEVKLRAQILSATAENIKDISNIINGIDNPEEISADVVEDNQDNDNEADDSEEDYDFNAARVKRTNALIYNDDDPNKNDENDEQHHLQFQQNMATKKNINKKKNAGKKSFDIFDMVKDRSDDEEKTDTDDGNNSGFRKRIKRIAIMNSDDDDDDDDVVSTRPSESFASSSRPASTYAELEDEFDNGSVTLQVSDDDDDDDNGNVSVVNSQPQPEIQRIGINSPSNVAETSTSMKRRERSDSEESLNNFSTVKRKRAAIISDDDDD